MKVPYNIVLSASKNIKLTKSTFYKWVRTNLVYITKQKNIFSLCKYQTTYSAYSNNKL